ncbi:MAG: very short patch repair endonuclease [Acidobacteria bacterium]|nr:very short patch repair endonuclease [Acidobacteriota bacterium]
MTRSAAERGRPRLSIRSRAPQASSLAVRKVMQANVGRTTQPEASLRSAAHRLGLRFRVNVRPEATLRCSADLLFRRAKVCVFVDGCFWHGCPEHFSPPRQNRSWWIEKIRINRGRDVKRTAELEQKGWKVVRYWEHQLTPHEARRAAVRLAKIVRRRLDRRP